MTAATAALAGIGGLYYSYACSVMPASIALAFYTATLAISVGVNIPPNIRLGNAATSEHAEAGREFFERRWTQWNIYRTWRSLAALVARCIAWGQALTAF
ncbi:MAG: anthrone oxygenase family protein [Pseudarthrobacter sp.]